MNQQGKAFGYLEAGRGLVASIFSSIALLISLFFFTKLENGVQSRNSIQLLSYSMLVLTIVYHSLDSSFSYGK